MRALFQPHDTRKASKPNTLQAAGRRGWNSVGKYELVQ